MTAPTPAALRDAADRLKAVTIYGDTDAESDKRIHEAAALLRRTAEEMESATADKRRLDFLDSFNVALNARYGTTYRWELILNHNINRLMLGHMMVDLNDARAYGLPSCRVAIDREMERIRAARAALNEGGKT